jgi:hypothetical protein
MEVHPEDSLADLHTVVACMSSSPHNGMITPSSCVIPNAPFRVSHAVGMDFFDALDKTSKKEKKEKKEKKTKVDAAELAALGIDSFGGAEGADQIVEKKVKKEKKDKDAKAWAAQPVEVAPAPEKEEAPKRTGAYMPPSKTKESVNKFAATLAAAPSIEDLGKEPAPKTSPEPQPAPAQPEGPKKYVLGGLKSAASPTSSNVAPLPDTSAPSGKYQTGAFKTQSPTSSGAPSFAAAKSSEPQSSGPQKYTTPARTAPEAERNDSTPADAPSKYVSGSLKKAPSDAPASAGASAPAAETAKPAAEPEKAPYRSGAMGGAPKPAAGPSSGAYRPGAFKGGK